MLRKAIPEGEEKKENNPVHHQSRREVSDAKRTLQHESYKGTQKLKTDLRASLVHTHFIFPREWKTLCAHNTSQFDCLGGDQPFHISEGLYIVKHCYADLKKEDV